MWKLVGWTLFIGYVWLMWSLLKGEKPIAGLFIFGVAVGAFFGLLCLVLWIQQKS